MKKQSLFLGFIIITIITLSIVQVSVANSLSTTGGELLKLQNQLSLYQKQNALLKEKYLQASALINIDSKAQKLGFVEAKSQEYLSTPMPLAFKQ